MVGTLEELEQRLRNFHLAKGKEAATSQVPQTTQAVETQPLSYEGIETTNHSYQREGRSIDPLDERIKKFLQQTIVLPEIPEMFAEFDSITLNLRPVKYDFPDNALAGQAGITLERYTVEEVAILGRRVIPMISSGFSTLGAAALFPLAYNLKAPRVTFTGEYVFPDVERIITNIADKRYDEYPENMTSIQSPFEPITATDVEKESAMYSYLACSMLRLFTKPVANYIKAWNRITDGYAKFYRKQAGMRLPTPTEASMRGLSNWFAVHRRARVTLYRILWLGNSREEYMGFKKFLYDMHLTYTGMHIVNILEQLCKQLKCSPGVVLALFNSYYEWERQIQCLTHLLEIMADTGECHKKRMWRYGRIFDETFMADLQTKACPRMVYIMASALQMMAPETHSGILEIAQLAEVSEEDKKKCTVAAKRVLQYIKEHP